VNNSSDGHGATSRLSPVTCHPSRVARQVSLFRLAGNRRRALGLALVALALSACTVGPDYVRPEVRAPESFRYEEKAARDLVNTAWWEQFQDPVLNELIDTALANNKSVQIAAAQVEQFMGQLMSTRSGMFPQLGYSGAAARQRVTQKGGPTPLPGSVNPIYDSYQAALGASWEIDLWGRIRRLTESARAQLFATEEARRGVILSLVASVATSYVNLLSLDQQLVISRNTTKSYAETLRLFELQFKQGVVSELQVAQVRAEYEGAAASIPQIEGQIVQLENALSILLGRNPGPIPRQGRTLGALAMPAVPTGVPSELLERRPDIRQAEQSLIAANAQIGAAKALYFPSISLTGLLGGVSTELSTLFGGASRTWSYAGSITGPIFTAGNIEGQVLAAEGGQQQALLSYQQTIQNAFADVEDALVSYQSQGQQLEALGRQLGALKTYVRLAQLQFDAGYTDYLTVLDANRNLFSSELVATSTRAGTFAAMVGIYQAMGGGWVTVAAERAGGTVPPPTDDAGPPG